MKKQKYNATKNVTIFENNEYKLEGLTWLSTDEAAVFLRRSRNAIYQLVSKKKLRRRKVEGKLYFNKEELDQLIRGSFVKGVKTWQ